MRCGGVGWFAILSHAVKAALSHVITPARRIRPAGTQNPAPRRICFAKTNGNRAELDRVGLSAHRFEACQNSRVMTSVQYGHATSSAAISLAGRRLLDEDCKRSPHPSYIEISYRERVLHCG